MDVGSWYKDHLSNRDGNVLLNVPRWQGADPIKGYLLDRQRTPLSNNGVLSVWGIQTLSVGNFFE